MRNREYDKAINCYQDITRRANAKGEFPIILLSEKDRKASYKKTLNMLANAYIDSAKLHFKTGKKYTETGLTQKAIGEFNMVFALDNSFGSLLPFKYMEGKEKWDAVIERSLIESIQCFISKKDWYEVIDKHLRLSKLDFCASFKNHDFAAVLGLKPFGEAKTVVDSFNEYQKLLGTRREIRLLKLQLSKLYSDIARSFEGSGNEVTGPKAYEYAVEVNPYNITAIAKLIQLHPKNWRYHYLSGEFYSSSKYYNHNKAKVAFDKVLLYKPEAFEGYYGIGKLFYLEKDYSKALKWLEKALSIRETGNSFYILSDIYVKRGKRVKASKYIRRAYYKNCDRMQRSILEKFLEDDSFLNYYNSEITYSYTVPPDANWGLDSTPPTLLITSIEKSKKFAVWINFEKGTEIVFSLKEKHVIKHIAVGYYFWNSSWAFPRTSIYLSNDNLNYRYVGELQKRLFEKRGYKGSTLRNINSSGRYIKLVMQQMKEHLALRSLMIFPARR